MFFMLMNRFKPMGWEDWDATTKFEGGSLYATGYSWDNWRSCSEKHLLKLSKTVWPIAPILKKSFYCFVVNGVTAFLYSSFTTGLF